MFRTSSPKNTPENIHLTMLEACQKLELQNWKSINPFISNELKSFVLMLSWIKEMKEKNEMDVEQARIHLDIQKNTTRTRLMALPEMNLLTTDQLLNQSIDAVRKEIYEYVGWVII